MIKVCSSSTPLLTRKIAETELARKAAVETQLEYICRQLNHLDITGRLSLSDEVPSEALVNRAMDVRSSVMLFLAVHIRYEAVRLGLLGKNTALLCTCILRL